MCACRIVGLGLVGGIFKIVGGRIEAAVPASIEERAVIGFEAEAHVEVKAAGTQFAPEPGATSPGGDISPKRDSLAMI